MPRKTPEDPARRQRRRRLRKMEASPIPCAVPGCQGGVVNAAEGGECCYTHSVEPCSGGHSAAWSSNDGIVDDIAIDIARRGLRRVPLTWIEYRIAVAHMLNDGLTLDQIRERTGVNSALKAAELKPIREIANALRNAA